ncbi:ABC transporter permease [Caproiciproducens galactitolivorans]|uniref:ABC transporter permease n=1 Tax=Caproiciproducens galactitolivorans TaxID=642589 RepID=A0ABT4BQ41_9FIRM|nr:ABC transporter permease [Caproiciproducens galactitolivorans]MCY1712998.1 ABC transporter permease [Caproiciproducens galactitolivorans]
MGIRDMLSMAFGNLFKRKVRTLLTVTGVVVGTCAIVVMMSLGIGIKQSMEDMMKNMGDLTVITIRNNSQSPDAVALDDKMLKKMKKMEHVVTLTPVFNMDSSAISIQSKKYKYQGMIYGVYLDTLKDFGYKTVNGELPAAGADKTTVLFGKDAEYDFMDSHKSSNNTIYPQPDKNGKMPEPYVHPMKDKFQVTVNPPENSTAIVKPVKLRCIGTLSEEGGKDPYPSHSIFMDVNFAKELQEKYNKLNNVKKTAKKAGYESASVKVDSVANVPKVEETIKDLGFTTYSMESIRKPMEEQMRTIQMILGGLGGISLFVAALGITNTMIMSIYERTREIGIMKVLGCIVRNIRTMFLIESGAIGFMGGVIGLVQSYAISLFINMVYATNSDHGGGGMMMDAAAGAAAKISIIPLWLALGALLFSTMIGLLSGFYPANRAVKISALTAIKQE